MNAIVRIRNAFRRAVMGRKPMRAGGRPVDTAGKKVPVYGLRTSFLDTVEGCAIASAPSDVQIAVLVVFNGFTEDVKHALSFAPGAGEHAERMQFWKDALSPALHPEMYHTALEYIARALVRAGCGD